MANINWRSSSRNFAISDSIVSIVALLLMVIATIIVTVAALSIPSSEFHKADRDSMFSLMWILWIALVVVSCVVAIHLWAAIKFWKATKEGADNVEGAKRARIYRNLNIALLIMSLLSAARIPWYAGVSTGLIFRGLIILYISNLIQELEEAKAIPGLGNPGDVVVNL